MAANKCGYRRPLAVAVQFATKQEGRARDFKPSGIPKSGDVHLALISYCLRQNLLKITAYVIIHSKDQFMPDLKTRMLFISHVWRYNEHYSKIVQWCNEAPNFIWKNCSVPSDDALTDKTSKGLSEGMTNQIRPAQGVIILAGMYAAHSAWIDYEITEAVRMGKVIIGVKPWGQERIPANVQNAAKVMVGWNSQSVIDAVRDYV